MTHLCCPSCHLRFGAAASAYLTACPECGLVLTVVTDPASLLGLRLFDPLDVAEALPEALAVSLPVLPVSPSVSERPEPRP